MPMKKIFVLCLLLGLLVYIVGCTTAQPRGTVASDTQGGDTAVETQTNMEVKISNFKFTPQERKVRVGDTVTWTNEDSVKHTVTSGDGSSELGSELFGKDETYSHQFTKAGTYTYYCIPHPNMKGTIIVE